MPGVLSVCLQDLMYGCKSKMREFEQVTLFFIKKARGSNDPLLFYIWASKNAGYFEYMENYE